MAGEGIIEFSGVALAETPFLIHIGGRTGEIDAYPRGRHLRGYLGYLALDMGLSMAEHFPDLRWDALVFRDMIPLCGCQRPYMVVKGGGLECPECGIFRPDIQDFSGKGGFSGKEVAEGGLYRFSIIVKDLSFLDEMRRVMDVVLREGLRIGSGITRGRGYFRVMEINEAKWCPPEGNRWVLQSPAVLPEGRQPLSIGRRVAENFEVVNLMVVPQGEIVNAELHGTGVGDYQGLGFGEVRAWV